MSANHTCSFGDTNNIPNLTDGTIHIVIKYEPIFDAMEIHEPDLKFFYGIWYYS